MESCPLDLFSDSFHIASKIYDEKVFLFLETSVHRVLSAQTRKKKKDEKVPPENLVPYFCDLII